MSARMVIIFIADYRREDWPEIVRHNVGLDDTFDEWREAATEAALKLAREHKVRRVLITPADFERERTRLGRRLKPSDRSRFVAELGKARSGDDSGLPGLPKGAPR
jgi:hypothetical protein